MARVAALAFPASSIVILESYILHEFAGVTLPGNVQAAETGLLMWIAAVLLGAGLKSKD